MKIYIIGCGGGGSWLAQVMVRLCDPKSVVLVDGDTLEEKNLDRQLFTADQIGRNKAFALASMLRCEFSDQWYHHHTFQHEPEDWIFSCVDNNPGRKSILEACDLYDCQAIVAGNETHSSEAYVYLPKWRGTHLDPRTYYPQINTDYSGNPAAIRIGCTGEAQVANRQLVTANIMAISLAAHLFVVWSMERGSLKRETEAFLPTRLYQNLTRNGFTPRGEITKAEKGA